MYRSVNHYEMYNYALPLSMAEGVPVMDGG